MNYVATAIAIRRTAAEITVIGLSRNVCHQTDDVSSAKELAEFAAAGTPPVQRR
jgi:hypothetical protein